MSDLSDDEIKREIQKRKDAATSLGLPAIIEYVFENLKHYPSWKKSSPESCLAEIENPREVAIEKVRGVAFVFMGHEYIAAESERYINFPDGDGCTSRDYFLYDANRKPLFSISGFVDHDEYASTFKFHEITAYIPGEWTKDIVKLHQVLKKYTELQKAEWEAKSASEKLKNQRDSFGL